MITLMLYPTTTMQPPTTSNVANNNNNVGVGNSTLFSMEELNSLCMEMITSLSVCKTKLDQFNAIARLATKFLYSNSNDK